MVAIKDMEMPKDCKKCPLMGTDGIPTDYFKPMMYVTIWATKHEIKHCIGGKILNDCPLVEIEERKGKWIKEKDVLGWDGYSYQCSVCGRSIHLDVEVEDLEDYPYCHCGAEMEIGEDGKWIDD